MMNTVKRTDVFGMTLIEVLIALAIVSIAMTAIIKATSENIRATTYLKNKTIALWVGQQIVNETRAGVLKLPSAPEDVSNTTIMLGQNWYWRANKNDTANARVKKIRVRVYSHPVDVNEDVTPLIDLESYDYHAE